eukprot:TRINITY_DN12273_c0_g1_i1.p1 TRINITY_DN12273_c0_g1~~TRINITY_DN12273_c0_g1_i1.p1  ORF type:complete len:194 (-),score=41.64 TRINITY_DN12273_c0_g1_i1:61-600(-)
MIKEITCICLLLVCITMTLAQTCQTNTECTDPSSPYCSLTGKCIPCACYNATYNGTNYLCDNSTNTCAKCGDLNQEGELAGFLSTGNVMCKEQYGTAYRCYGNGSCVDQNLIVTSERLASGFYLSLGIIALALFFLLMLIMYIVHVGNKSRYYNEYEMKIRGKLEDVDISTYEETESSD